MDAVRHGGAQGPRPLATLVAPGGYGKTTLLGLVAASGSPRGLYLSLAEAEHHPRLFLDLFMERLREAAPTLDFGPLIDLKRDVPTAEYARRLPWAVARTLQPAGPFLLLLDDVDTLEPAEPLAGVLSGLVAAASPELRVLLSGRDAPSWDLRRAADAPEPTRWTATDLALDAIETGALLELASGREVSTQLAGRVHARTAGWPVAVELIGRLLSDADADPEDLLDATASADDAMGRLVVAQLLTQRRPAEAYFMKVLSVLDRATPELAAALFGHTEQARDWSPAARRLLIQLSREDVERYLDKLTRERVLRVGPGGDGLAFPPLVREALHELFRLDDEVATREAHRRAAEHLLGCAEPTSADGRVRRALDHLVAARAFERLLTVLEPVAELLLLAGYHRRLAKALVALEGHYATLPLWACYYLARVYVGLGQWDHAKTHLDSCRARLGDAEALGDLWRWHPRVHFGLGELYWRRGMPSEARTYCQRGHDYLDQQLRRGAVPEECREEALGLRLEMLLLLGTLRLEAGLLDKAREVFEMARELAREAGQTRAEALALDDLGLIARRRGDIGRAAAAYETALALVVRAEDIDSYSRIALHLGECRRLVGDIDGATELLADAVALRADTGHPESIAAATVALAVARAAAGDTEEADTCFRRGLAELDFVEAPRTLATCAIQYATFLARQGRPVAARTQWEAASTLIATRLRAAPPLVALRRAAAGEIARAEGQLGRAVTELSHAAELYENLGAAFEVARLRWRLAAVEHERLSQPANGDSAGAAGAAQGQPDPDDVVAALELACAAANKGGYRLGPDAGSEELCRVGCTFGEPQTISYCARVLGRLGVELQARDETAGGSPEPTPYDRLKAAETAAGAYVVTTRADSASASEEDIEQLVATAGESELVLHLPRQEMINHGKRVALGQKRIILPLLVHFLRRPDGAFTMNQLATDVWESPTLDDGIRTKVKVAISRLRSLLGKARPYILTRREIVDGHTMVTYGLDPGVAFHLVEFADEQLG